MELKKKIIFATLVIVAIILFFNTSSYAGTQRWNSLDYDVTLNEDGSMDIIETWDVYVSETNTLFKAFEISNYDDYKMKNVKVSEIKNGKEVFLTQINRQQYHVDSGCYYGLQIDNSTYEIAWNVGLDNSSDTRVYKMYYTVENAVEIYEDCTELYWQFLSNENEMIGRNITGTIKLPNKVNDIEKLRVWGHGPLDAVIHKDSNDKVSFSVDSISSNQMLEVRIVTEENIYENASNNYHIYRLEEILEEEQKWADEANKEREEAKETLAGIIGVFIIMALINVVAFIVLLRINKKYKDVGKELKEKYSYEKSELQYFREIPDEDNATPARASYFYYLKNNSSHLNSYISKIFSATMLNLSLKGLIEFNATDEKNVEIYLKQGSQSKSVFLSEDERIVFNLLNDAILYKGKECVTPKEFEKYASANYETVYRKLNRIQNVVENDLKIINKISSEKNNINKKWKSKFSMFLCISIFSFAIVPFPAITLGLILITHTCYKNSTYVSILSTKGNEEEKQWKALKKYMEDYSMLDEKLVPDIILWEKYLVYATAFGISKKVIKQLKSVHPEMFYNETGSNLNTYGYWHIMNNSRLGDDWFDNFNNSLENVCKTAQSAYNVAHSSSSSGSGGGGGFSGGGGGRRRRRKLRRSLIIYFIYNKKMINKSKK